MKHAGAIVAERIEDAVASGHALDVVDTGTNSAALDRGVHRTSRTPEQCQSLDEVPAHRCLVNGLTIAVGFKYSNYLSVTPITSHI